MERRLLYRWLASGVLWLLLLIVVIISIRSINIVNRTGRIAANALTAENEQMITGVRDTARSFAVEWATWNGNSEDYINRMGLFLEKVPTTLLPPNTVQEVTGSSVLTVNKENKEDYSVRILLHTHRVVAFATGTDLSTTPAVYVPVTREDLVRFQSNITMDLSQLPTMSWQDYLLYVEVPVKINNNQPVVAGWPVIVSPNNTKGNIAQTGCNLIPTNDFLTFVNQFMNMYYSGQPLTNFVLPNSDIKPVYGWKLDSVDEVRVNNDKKPTLARVQVSVSAPGVNKLIQVINLKLQYSGGNCQVKDLGAF